MKYKVLDFLNHNQKLFEPGEEVELPKEDAEQLLVLGVIEQLTTKKATTEEK